jgi:hypothetical protein
MYKLYVRIAPQLAEYCSALDSFVAYTIELSEQGCATYFSHYQVLSSFLKLAVKIHTFQRESVEGLILRYNVLTP